MALKINELVIQAKVIESQVAQREVYSPQSPSSAASIPDSVKKEIVEECIEKVIELLEKRSDSRRTW